MKKYTYILTLLFAIICTVSNITFAQSETPKFDAELMSNFSKGMGGDSAAMELAVAKAEKILAVNPKDARILVWFGTANLAQSGKVFMSGDYMNGGKLWKDGRTKMDEAVSIDGENLFKLGKGDLDKIIALTEGKTDEKSKGIRNEAVKNLINYYTVKSDKEKVESYKKMLTTK
ncbi:MAG: hypothetical protein MUC29_10185 [Pyrinomonadaceae bacterium]|nr:hypothetical protein [Pyrinomonadaceae bacterium]